MFRRLVIFFACAVLAFPVSGTASTPPESPAPQPAATKSAGFCAVAAPRSTTRLVNPPPTVGGVAIVRYDYNAETNELCVTLANIGNKALTNGSVQFSLDISTSDLGSPAPVRPTPLHWNSGLKPLQQTLPPSTFIQVPVKIQGLTALARRLRGKSSADRVVAMKNATITSNVRITQPLICQNTTGVMPCQ